MKILLAILPFFFAALDAAAEGTHVYFASKYLALHKEFNPEGQKAFIAGTLFPDIRYLGTVSRGKTHEKHVSSSKIANAKTPFHAGLLLHCLVDDRREAYVKKSRILHRIKGVPKKKRESFLKLVEDEILWEKFDLELAKDSLRIVLPEESKRCGSEETARRWHESLLSYFQMSPSRLFSKLAIAGEGFANEDPNTVVKWSALIAEYAHDAEFIAYVEAMVDKVFEGL